MAKKKKEYLSFIEDGQRYIQCKYCYNYVPVGDNTVASTCWKCVAIIGIKDFEYTLPKSWNKKESSGKPPGWHFMKEFVDKDGNVFYKGEEQPELKGTLSPTKVKKRKKKKKLTYEEKLQRDLTNWKKRKKAKRRAKK